MAISQKTRRIVPLLTYSVLLFFIYCDTILWLIRHDWVRGDFNYCYLIPVIVVYLLWEKRKSFYAAGYSWAGFLPLSLGIILFWAGELSGEFFSQYISLWLVIVGLILAHLGRRGLERIWFPIVFILAMFPPPQFLTNRLTLKLKLLSSQLGVWLMQMWGMSAYREGNIIDLGFTRSQVVAACMSLPPTASILCFTFLGSQLR